MNRQPYVSNLPLRHQGKVRDSFNGTTTPDTFLMVATDTISTHNVVHLSAVPLKGQILTASTVFWIQEVLADIPHHVVTYGQDIYEHLPTDREYPEDLHLRALVVKELDMSPHEFIFRRRMAGSLWGKFYSKGLPNPYGFELPAGLQLMSPFDQPIFTPTEKSETDDPENAEAVHSECPEETALAELVYDLGFDFARQVGLEIIDFKAEVGRDKDGRISLGDEWLNGDCCRFVRTAEIVIGREPPWADKEIFRKEAFLQWGKASGPPLQFPQEVIEKGVAGYLDVFQALTGATLEEFQREHF